MTNWQNVFCFSFETKQTKEKNEENEKHYVGPFMNV